MIPWFHIGTACCIVAYSWFGSIWVQCGFSGAHLQLQLNAPCSSQVTAPAKLIEKAYREEFVALFQKIQEAVV